jgi:hypothetical protein
MQSVVKDNKCLFIFTLNGIRSLLLQFDNDSDQDASVFLTKSESYVITRLVLLLKHCLSDFQKVSIVIYKDGKLFEIPISQRKEIGDKELDATTILEKKSQTSGFKIFELPKLKTFDIIYWIDNSLQGNTELAEGEKQRSCVEVFNDLHKIE